jgi:predicted nucleotidyltransferase component of viral defense system
MDATGIETEWQADMGYSVDLSYRGPLYDGRDHTKGKVRLDANLRPEMVDVQSILITSEYDDIRPFVLSVISREHLLAEKVRALVVRGKARDLYDLWLLVNQGVTAPEGLIQTKLDLYDLVWSKEAWSAGVRRVETEWERDLRPLIPQFIDFATARKQTEAVISFPPE